MRIVVFSRGLPTQKFPMNGIFEFDQAKALKKVGVDIIYIAVDLRSIRHRRKFGYKKLTKDGIPVYTLSLPLGRFPQKIMRFIRKKSLKYLLSKVNQEIGVIDIVHSHFINQTRAAVDLKSKFGYKVVMTEHYSGLMSPKLESDIIENGNAVYKYVDKLICVSPGLQQVIWDNFCVESVYVPNVIDTDTFSLKEPRNGRTFKFITVGSLISRKGIDQVIRSFARLYKENDSIRLTVIGGGPERENLESIVSSYSLHEVVEFTGLIERSRISKLIRESDCFVLASKAETFGVVYLEAMSSGLPVIATRNGGVDHMVEAFNGRLIEVDDEQSLFTEMQSIIVSIASYNNVEIRNYVVDNFSERTVSSRIKEIYDSIMGLNL